MGTTKKKRTPPQVSSDRQKWEIIFNALKQMLRKQQSQIDSLVEERKLIDERIKIRYDRWVSDVLLLEDQISQMRRQISLADFAKLVEAAKGKLMAGSKQRDAFVYKRKLEHAQSELNDFKAWFDILSHRCPDQEDISPNTLYESLKEKGGRESSSKETSTRLCGTLEKEVAMLKREYEKLSVKNSADISALQTEINFVWNQYKEMESNYTNQLQTKNDEIVRANNKIVELLTSVEQLQSSNTEKDNLVTTLRATITKFEAEVNLKDRELSRLSKELEESRSTSLRGRRNVKKRGLEALEEGSSSEQLKAATVASLRAKITELETEATNKKGEIFTLSKELESLRSKDAANNTSALKRCTREPSSSRSRGTGNGRNRGSAVLKEELSYSRQVVTRSKRKQDDAITIDKTPNLFTSDFKIPKLKSQSPKVSKLKSQSPHRR